MTYRLPNGEEHRGFFRPEAIKDDGHEAGPCCDIYYESAPWERGGKFIESGPAPVREETSKEPTNVTAIKKNA